MKSAIIASVAMSALILTGCASNPNSPAKFDPQGKHETTHHKKHAMPFHKHGKLSQNYTCQSNATIKAVYNPDDKQATLNITAPTLGLNAQDVVLAHVKPEKPSTHKKDKDTPPNPKERGFEFVNETNADAKYHWQAFGRDGVLSITTPTTTHTIACQSDEPMHEHDGHPHGMPPKEAPHNKPTA